MSDRAGPEVSMLYYHPTKESFAREALKLQVLQVMQASSAS